MFGSIFTMAFAFTPSTLICLVVGYLWGLWMIPLVIVAYFFASAVGFEICRKVDHGALYRTLHKIPKVATFMEKVVGDSFWWVLFSRVLPTLPFAMVNVVFSILPVRRAQYYGASMIGMVPRTIIAVWIGANSTKIFELDMLRRPEIWWPLVGIGILWLVLKVCIKFFR